MFSDSFYINEPNEPIFLLKIIYRSEIDGLRAIAVLSVVIFHFFPHFLPNGYLGVDIFFVISGFLITTHLLNLEGQNLSIVLKSFYKRRIIRLFPALFLFLTLTYIFVNQFFLSVDVDKFQNSLLASYTFYANFYFWRDGGYFGGSDQLKPLLHIWSLSVEEQFYLFFPIFLLIFVNLNRKYKYSLEFGVALLTTLSFIFWLLLNYIGGENPAFFLLPTRVWQFSLGALLAIIVNKGVFPSISMGINNILFVGSVGFIALAIFIDLNAQFQTTLITFGALGFVAFSKSQNNFILSAFRSKLSVFFGKISYSLYLYHWPIAVALTYYFVDGTPVPYLFLGVFVSVLLGVTSYKLIEQIFRRRLNFNATLYFMAFCSAVSLMVYLTNVNKEEVGLANTWSKASGANFRCEISSIRPYGASRACSIITRETSDSTVALLGNSHAQMYVPLVSEVVPNNLDLLLVPLNGCLPTTTINVSQKCLDRARTNLSEVSRDDNISTVIIATTWYNDSYVDDNGNDIDRSKLNESINQLVEDIRGSGKYPILLSPLAISNRDYASELPRKLRFNHLSEHMALDMIKVPRSYFDKQFSDTNLFFEESMGNAYVKVYDDLCDQYYCFFGTKDLFYFADANHLSKHAFIAFSKSKKQLKTILADLE